MIYYVLTYRNGFYNLVQKLNAEQFAAYVMPDNITQGGGFTMSIADKEEKKVFDDFLKDQGKPKTAMPVPIIALSAGSKQQIRELYKQQNYSKLATYLINNKQMSSCGTCNKDTLAKHTAKALIDNGII